MKHIFSKHRGRLKLKTRMFSGLLIIVIILISSLTSFGVTINYTYDNFHRLTRVERPNGIVTIYQYDELGNRTLKVTTNGPISYYCDSDSDGFIDSSSDGSCNGYGCQPENCQTTAGNDCNDSDSSINPDTRWYPDSDGDNYGDRSIAYQQCNPPSSPPNYVLDNTDYNDNDPDIYGIPVKISGDTPSYYSTLQEAYNAAIGGDTIQVQAVTFNEGLSINLNKTVTISGGYNGTFTLNSGKTKLFGNIWISDGILNLGNFELQP